MQRVCWADLARVSYLGCGEFCNVWAAELAGAPVAVKILKEQHRANELALKDLESEAQVMLRLRHPGATPRGNSRQPSATAARPGASAL